jgi:Tol biopolymer transport system component/DNA-binding CsgD family transcriptional regulator
MRRRGRPPHPDILTPREWEVLELVDRGLTNQEIATRLGISFDGAKFHVAQILNKLGVSRREDAARAAYGGKRRLLPRLVLAPLALSRLGKVAAGVGLAAAAAGFIAFALLVLLHSSATPARTMYPGLYVIDVRSGRLTMVADWRTSPVSQFDWTPDGRGFVAVKTGIGPQPARVEVIDAKGATVRSDDNNLDSAGFAVLEDGSLGLTIRHSRSSAAFHPSGIARMDIQTLTLADFRPFDKLDRASWAPDGSRVVVDAEPEGQAYGTYVIEGKSAPQPASHRWYSPDGSLYAEEAPEPQQGLGIYDAVTGGLQVTIPGIGARPWSLSWSPDGRWIASIEGTLESGDVAELLVAPSDGSGPAAKLMTAADAGDYVNAAQAGPNGSVGWLDWSPNSQTLAFVKSGQIWLVDRDGTRSHKLADAGLPMLTEPRWSPDGTRLAFRAVGSGGTYIADYKGQDRRYLGPFTVHDVSQNGRTLAFAYGPAIFTAQARGSAAPTEIAKLDFQVATDFYPAHFCQIQFPFDYGPHLSPDGKLVAFNGGGFSDPPSILIARSDGADDPEVFDRGYLAQWSPDGRRLAYVRDCEIHVAAYPPQSGAKATPAVSLPGYRFSWRPDGGITALQPDGSYVSYDGSGNVLASFPRGTTPSPSGDFAAVVEIRNEVVDTPDGPVQKFDSLLSLLDSSGSELASFEHMRNPSFSPDGRYLAFIERYPFAGSETLRILDLRALQTPPRPITSDYTVNVVWSPDSRKLAILSSDFNGPQTLSVLNLADLQAVDLSSNASNPIWLPDGSRLLYQQR